MTTTLAPRAGRRAAPTPSERPDAQHADEQQRMRRGRFVWQVLSGVIVIAIVGVAAAALVVPRVLGGAGLIVETGSMRPAIEPGDLVAVVAVDPHELRVGDVVTYATETSLITHRVVGFTGDGGEERIVMQGDANDVADKPIEPEQVRGKVAYSIPRLGFVKEWVASNLLLLGGGLALVWAAYAVVGSVNRRRGTRKGAREAAEAAEAEAARLADVDMLRRAALDAEAAARTAEQQADAARSAAVAAMAAADAAAAAASGSGPDQPAAHPSHKEQS